MKNEQPADPSHSWEPSPRVEAARKYIENVWAVTPQALDALIAAVRADQDQAHAAEVTQLKKNKDDHGAALLRVDPSASVNTELLPNAGPIWTDMGFDWQRAALLLGEQLAANGPEGYYGFTADQWLTWARSQVGSASVVDGEASPATAENRSKDDD